jgi:four helix bundle protein
MASEATGDIRTFRDLVAWQRGVDLTDVVYRLTAGFPAAERFGLVSQMRRAAVSVPANVAEGYGRGRRAEYIRHLEIARASLYELQTHAEVARRQGWLDEAALSEFSACADEVNRILWGLLKSLRQRQGDPGT